MFLLSSHNSLQRVWRTHLSKYISVLQSNSKCICSWCSFFHLVFLKLEFPFVQGHTPIWHPKICQLCIIPICVHLCLFQDQFDLDSDWNQPNHEFLRIFMCKSTHTNSDTQICCMQEQFILIFMTFIEIFWTLFYFLKN